MCIATFGRPEKKMLPSTPFFFLLQEEARSQRTSNYGRTPKGSFSAKCSDTYQAQFLNWGLKIHCSNNPNHSMKYFFPEIVHSMWKACEKGLLAIHVYESGITD